MAITPIGTNQIGTAARGPIVDAQGNPTQYFYRQLLALVQTPQAIQDLEIQLALVPTSGDALSPEDTVALDDVFGASSAASADDPDIALTPPAPVDASDAELLGWLAPKGDAAYARPEIRDVLANIPNYLNASDDGQIFTATDYKHRYRWDGAGLAWHFLEGDGSGQVVMGKPNGAAPNGGLWGLCDGSTYAVAQDDGSTVNVTTQNLTGDVFIKGGYSTGAQQAATTPTWAAGAKTDIGNAAISNDTDAGVTAATAAGSPNVAAKPHTHTDTGHQHTLSNANATLNAPSETNGGLPLRIGNNWYIRR